MNRKEKPFFYPSYEKAVEEAEKSKDNFLNQNEDFFVLDKHCGLKGRDLDIHRMTIQVIAYKGKLFLSTVGERGYYTILKIAKNALIEMHDNLQTSDFIDVLDFLRPILLKFAITNLVHSLLFAKHPDMSSFVYFNDSGRFVIEYKKETFYIKAFRAKQKFSYIELKAQEKFMAQGTCDGLFSYGC
ncbi:MAG: hypothetical protein L3J75_08160 [Methylococcaceae bacterium]|nr:hypothetical protein [Methylococcaceae bacterium]